MSPAPAGMAAERTGRTLFEKRLHTALNIARGGETAIVIVPSYAQRHLVLTQLAHLLDRERDHNARWTQDALHFEGTRGQVRVYPCDHHTYDRRRKRLLDYPHTVQTFLHPQVEALGE